MSAKPGDSIVFDTIIIEVYTSTIHKRNNDRLDKQTYRTPESEAPRARSASVVAPQGFSTRAFRSRRRKKHLELLGWIAMGHRTLPRWQCTSAVLLWLLLSVPTAAAASLPLQGSRPDASANLEWLRVGTWFPALSSNLFRARSHSATMITAIASIGSTGAGETQQQQRQQHPRRSPAIDARDCTHSGALGAATDACVLGADVQCRAVSSGPGTASANLLPGTSLPPNLLLDIELPVSGLNLLRARSTCCEHDADSSKSTDQDPRSIDECTIDGSNGPGNLVCVCVCVPASTHPPSLAHTLSHTHKTHAHLARLCSAVAGRFPPRRWKVRVPRPPCLHGRLLFVL